MGCFELGGFTMSGAPMNYYKNSVKHHVIESLGIGYAHTKWVSFRRVYLLHFFLNKCVLFGVMNAHELNSSFNVVCVGMH